MGRPPSAVAEIAALVPQSKRSLPWWERVSPEVAEALPGILEAYRGGKFGPHMKPAALGISAWLKRHGIAVGHQGVLTWLHRHARP